MRFQYICERIKGLAEDMKDAKKYGDQDAFEHDLRILRKAVRSLAEHVNEERKDSAFFEGELVEKEEPKQTIGAHVKEKKEDSCGAVDAFKKRRQARKDAKCVEAFRKRRQDRLDEKDEGRWITTENNHKIHINEEGEPDKGNPFCHR